MKTFLTAVATVIGVFLLICSAYLIGDMSESNRLEAIDRQGNFGWIDIATCNHVEGWAWDPDRPDTPVVAIVFYGGKIVGSGMANVFREDLKNKGVGNGAHEFVIDLPMTLKYSYGVKTPMLTVEVEATHQQIGGSPVALSCVAAGGSVVRNYFETETNEFTIK
jgi:hypothetical protein